MTKRLNGLVPCQEVTSSRAGLRARRCMTTVKVDKYVIISLLLMMI